MKILISNFYLTAILFLYIFGTTFKILPINGSYIAVALIIFLNFRKFKKLIQIKEILFLILLFLFMGTYSLLLSIIYGFDNYFFKILIGIISYIIVGFFIVDNFYNNNNEKYSKLNQMMYLFVIIICFNSFIIVIEYLNTDFKNFIEGLIVENNIGEVTYLEHPFRIRGLSNAGGSSLSILIAIGIIFSIYLYFIKRLSFNYLMFFLIIMNTSNIFTGRTGLMIGLLVTSLFLLITFYRMFSSLLFFLNIFIFILLVVTIYFIFIESLKLENNVLSWSFELFINFFDSGKLETSSSNELLTMIKIPENLLHLLFGIGFYEGEKPLMYMRSDVGYIKSIYSIGLIFTIILYLVLLYLLLKLKNVNYLTKFWVPFFVLGLMIIEIKEPFIYQNYLARILFSLVGAYIYCYKYTCHK